MIAQTARPVSGLDDLHGVGPVEHQDGRVRFDVDPEGLGAAMALLGEAGIQSLVSHPPTLEELFLREYGDRVEREPEARP